MINRHITFAEIFTMTELPQYITRLNGKNLYYLFLAGSKKILENQVEINKINVFPVPDADTGTNLASTIRSVLDHIRPSHSYKATADAIAMAALSGARGNSGVIFAQFLYGLSAETADEQEITLDRFAESVKRAVAYVYDAITHPVEGTMLTVIREWAEFIHERKENMKDFNEMFSSALEAARLSLHGTTAKLKELARANVVDAGAKGFVVFLEGIMEYLTDRNLKKVLQVSKDVVHLEAVHEVNYEEIHHRYCTEVMIKGEEIDRERVRELANAAGDSVVLAGSRQTLRLHVHTNHPDVLLSSIREHGRITFQKVDDMVKQYEVAHHRKYSIALVTDSTSDIPAVILDHYQIHQVPINIEIEGSQFLDKVTINPEQFYQLMESNKSAPSTSQTNEVVFVNLYSHLLSHYDSVIAVHISRHFSGTWQNSYNAARKIMRETGKTITVIDSGQISGSMGLGVIRMARLIEQGKSHEELVSVAEGLFRESKILVAVRDLKYLVRSGRVSPLKGLIGRMLNMVPIITVNREGKAEPFSKAISQKGTLKRILREVQSYQDAGRMGDYIVLQARNPETSEWFTAEMTRITGREPVSVVQVSPSLALHAGVGTVAVAFLPDRLSDPTPTQA